MLNFCKRYLKHRKLVVLVFLVLVVVAALQIPRVGINYSMVDYLPSTMESKQALDQMEDSFGGGVPNARLYAEGIGPAQAEQLSKDLADVEGVTEVMWLGTQVDTKKPDAVQDADVVSSWKTDEGYLYQLTIDSGSVMAGVDGARAVATQDGATQVSMSGDAVDQAYSQESSSTEIVYIILIAVAIVIVILEITSHSWFEPVVFLVPIGCAIALNMGTNIFLGSISNITQICAAVLQLAVSMDYSIVLLHTFRGLQADHPDPVDAMAHAMMKGFSVVLSSAAVTFFGFLSLTVMQFGIGVNMGIVLAKGIVFSFLSIMFFMPCFLLICLKPLDKLEHRYLMPSFGGFARVCQKIMTPLAIIVILVAVPAYLGQENNSFKYGSGDFAAPDSQNKAELRHIDDAFGASESWVVMVPEGQWANEQALIDDLEAEPMISGVTSYITVAGRAMPVDVVPDDQKEQVISNGLSRLVLTVDVTGENQEAFDTVERVRALARQYYGDDAKLVGNMVSTYDLMDVVHQDSGRVKAATMISIGLVLALMFRSLSIPLITLAAIEVAIWINMAFPYFLGQNINYIGYLVIDAVQMGAAVDYAIIFEREYFDRRKLYLPREAARSAIKHSALTILTSALILTFAGLAVKLVSSNMVISQIGELICRGAFVSMLMMFVFLPWLFRMLDGVIRHTTLKLDFYAGPARSEEEVHALLEAQQAEKATAKGASATPGMGAGSKAPAAGESAAATGAVAPAGADASASEGVSAQAAPAGTADKASASAAAQAGIAVASAAAADTKAVPAAAGATSHAAPATPATTASTSVAPESQLFVPGASATAASEDGRDEALASLVDLDSIVEPVTKPDISGKILSIVKGTLNGDTEAQARINGVHVIARGEASGELPRVDGQAVQSIGAIPLATLEEMTRHATLDDIKASIDRLTSVIAAQQVEQTQRTLRELRQLQAELTERVTASGAAQPTAGPGGAMETCPSAVAPNADAAEKAAPATPDATHPTTTPSHDEER